MFIEGAVNAEKVNNVYSGEKLSDENNRNKN